MGLKNLKLIQSSDQRSPDLDLDPIQIWIFSINPNPNPDLDKTQHNPILPIVLLPIQPFI